MRGVRDPVSVPESQLFATVEASGSSVELLTTTLAAHGYVPLSARRLPQALLLTYEFPDDFGCVIRYVIALTDGELKGPALEAVRKIAARRQAHLVIVGRAEGSFNEPVLSLDEFTARFGGGIPSLLPLDPAYATQLRELGHNRLPEGLTGRPEHLFERYVHAGLQFITGRRVIRYGQDRLGESVPDGLILLGGSYVLYDAKSAANGFEVDSETERQCQAYSEDFATRYKEILGRPYAFLLVSGSFAQTREVLERRSHEVYSRSQVPLTCLDAATMGSAVQCFSTHPRLRSVVDWRAIFSNPVISPEVIHRAVRLAARDKVRGG